MLPEPLTDFDEAMWNLPDLEASYRAAEGDPSEDDTGPACPTKFRVVVYSMLFFALLAGVIAIKMIGGFHG
ncbi:MAG TPA: hypothetical protein VFS39_00550 [Nitrospira sp.]|nr:hypothetical protein [Nitrospira sp.]